MFRGWVTEEFEQDFIITFPTIILMQITYYLCIFLLLLFIIILNCLLLLIIIIMDCLLLFCNNLGIKIRQDRVITNNIFKGRINRLLCGKLWFSVELP